MPTNKYMRLSNDRIYADLNYRTGEQLPVSLPLAPSLVSLPLADSIREDAGKCTEEISSSRYVF